MDIDHDQESSISYTPTLYSAESGTTAPSVYSYSSSRDGQHYLRQLGGRTVNAKNDLYLLPAGELGLIVREINCAKSPASREDEYEHNRLYVPPIAPTCSHAGCFEKRQTALRPPDGCGWSLHGYRGG